MELNSYQIILVFWTMFNATQSTPSCTTYGGKDVVCKAGREDHILERHLVSDNNITTGITLRECRITDVELESFENLFSLKYLDLSKNKIRNLKLGVLDGTEQVTYLNLSGNLLTSFELGIFDQKPNLEVLDLKGNKIKEIELGVFDPLKKLRHLDLSNNLLRSLDPYIFDQSNGIRFLDFSQNDMSDAAPNLLHSLKELNILNLDRCSLNSVPEFLSASNIYTTLSHLIISTNNIETVDDTHFSKLVNLEILDLTGSNVKSVTDNAFKFSKKLKSIQLRYNQLTSIPDTLFQSAPVLNTVDLSHNKLKFIPVNAFRGTKIRNLNVSDNRFSYLQDNFCLELRNSGVMLTKFYFNQNPWQCACLKDVLDEVKLYGISYNNSKYNGSEPVCTISKGFLCKRQPEFNDNSDINFEDN